MKMKKICIAILVMIMGMIASSAVSVGATESTPKLSIDFCNLSFRDSVCIKYAVASNVNDVKVLIWDEPQVDYKAGTHDYELTSVGSETIGGKSYMIFDFTNLVAKQMTDVVYARAYTEVDEVAYYSDINKYSILQYAYNKLGKTGTASDDENLKNMLNDMLTYGASAQKYFDYKVERLATDAFYQVKLAAGLLDDGCNHGLYLSGDQITLTAPESDADGKVFSHWEDGQGNLVGSTTTYVLTVGEKNETYTPVYQKYSEGLEFDSNGDGTCYVTGMGTCTDLDLVIPSVSPEGDTVIGIDSSSFAGEPIQTVVLPSTLQEIGRRAFNECTSLTDVYFEGTSEQWENVDISTGNTSLENAQIHFKEEVVQTYTVTFKDYDGTVLKTEEVESGKAATAPANPSRDGYIFTGWDQSFGNVISDMEIVAQYQKNTAPTLAVSNVTTTAGATNVEVVVQAQNNPGIAGMTLGVEYDENVLTLTKVTSHEVLSGLSFQKPKTYKSGCNLVWYGTEPDEVVDGTAFKLVFTIDSSAQSGTYPITLTYSTGYDANLGSIEMTVINGSIVIN